MRCAQDQARDGAAGRSVGSGMPGGVPSAERSAGADRGREQGGAGKAPVLRGCRGGDGKGGAGPGPGAVRPALGRAGLLPAALSPGCCPMRCAEPAESPPQLQAPGPSDAAAAARSAPGPTGRMEPPEGASPGGECGP